MKVTPTPKSQLVAAPAPEPAPESSTTTALVIYDWDALYPVFSALEPRLRARHADLDDDHPPYQSFQRISSQISRAQSGEGPIRARMMDIAEIAIACILSIDRS